MSADPTPTDPEPGDHAPRARRSRTPSSSRGRDDHGPRARRGDPSRRSWLSPLLAVVLLAALAGAVWTGLDVREVRAEQRADREALEAGRSAATDFTSYDYTRLDEDLDRVTERSTGAFRDQFTQALGALTQAIKQAKGVSVGRVTHAGLTQLSGDTAVVVAAVDATITNTSSTEPSIRRYRLQITLDRSSGDWLISDITPVA